MENLGGSMIVNTCGTYTPKLEAPQKMHKIRIVELSLRALRCYDPDDYVAEINEIYDCIVEGRSYEDEPSLTEMDMIDILDNLTRESKNTRKNSLRAVLLEDGGTGKKKIKTRQLLSDVLMDY